MTESSTHTSIKLYVRIVQNGSLKALNSKNTSCVAKYQPYYNKPCCSVHITSLIIIKVAPKSCRGIPSLFKRLTCLANTMATSILSPKGVEQSCLGMQIK